MSRVFWIYWTGFLDLLVVCFTCILDLRAFIFWIYCMFWYVFSVTQGPLFWIYRLYSASFAESMCWVFWINWQIFSFFWTLRVLSCFFFWIYRPFPSPMASTVSFFLELLVIFPQIHRPWCSLDLQVVFFFIWTEPVSRCTWLMIFLSILHLWNSMLWTCGLGFLGLTGCFFQRYSRYKGLFFWVLFLDLGSTALDLRAVFLDHLLNICTGFF